MSQQLNQLIQSLRNELMAYTKMAIFLERHFQFLAHPLDGEVGETASDIQIQSRIIQSARKQHARALATLARTLQLTADVRMEQIIPLLPAGNRPLVIALVRAGREVTAQVLRSRRHNQAALKCAMVRVRQYLNSVFPEHFPPNNSTTAPEAFAIPIANPTPPVIFKVKINIK